MESWSDQGIVLSARPHGENGAVVSLLTEEHGQHAGFFHGGQSSRKRALIEPGTLVKAEWNARVSDQLGTYSLEEEQGLPAGILQDSLKLGALLSACSLCDAAMPEREAHRGLFHGLQALIQTMEGEAWAAAYIIWELALLKELGFGLDLTRCAGGGDAQTLAYVSPKSGCAVSYEAGAPYQEKLLPLPGFLKPNGGPGDDDDILTGLNLTGYFLAHWVFAHHSKGVPEPRLRFASRFEARVEKRMKDFEGENPVDEKDHIQSSTT